ncbi:hypothetical protein AB6A23_12630 [Paenibacillus tarimensis]
MNPRSRRIIIVVLGGIILLWIVSFMVPELTIRRYILFRFHPISSISAEISNKRNFDQKYGYLFEVDGYKHRITGDELNIFYLKKYGPLWVVSSTGTGP